MGQPPSSVSTITHRVIRHHRARQQLTRRLREAARALDIELHDHVVVGNAEADPTGLGYYSFRCAGLL
jgi:DNA repair protein RadC